MAKSAAAWVHVPGDGGVSIKKSAILAVTQAQGSVLITLSGTSVQLKLNGVTRDRLMQLIAPPRYDDFDDY